MGFPVVFRNIFGTQKYARVWAITVFSLHTSGAWSETLFVFRGCAHEASRCRLYSAFYTRSLLLIFWQKLDNGDILIFTDICLM